MTRGVVGQLGKLSDYAPRFYYIAHIICCSWMAPEQILSEAVMVSLSADIFSWGMTALEVSCNDGLQR